MTMTVDDVAEKLREIGLKVEKNEQASGFLELVDIVNGVIHYQPEATISNLLHEAGHLACLPEMFREKASGDLDEVTKEMYDYTTQWLEKGKKPDAPIIRAIMQCSDPEATAWAWAFGKHLGLADETIIQDEEYDGNGASVRLQVSTGMYFGVNGLRAAGMIERTRDWPYLTKWTQDASAED